MFKQNILNVGDRFGKLILLEIDHVDKNYIVHWKYKCDCGTTGLVREECLLRKRPTRSCGCLRKIGRPNKYIAKKPGWLSAAKWAYRIYRDGDISFEEFIELSQKPCQYCGRSKQNRLNPYMTRQGEIRKSQSVTPQRARECWWDYNGLDRIDSSLPHNKDNCVPCCGKCNRMKSSMGREEFLHQCQMIANYSSTSNIDVTKA